MPTAVWTGTISFGLVTVPVRLVPATEPKDVRFHLYDRAGRRVRYERVVDPQDEPSAPAPENAAPAPTEPDAEPEGGRSTASTEPGTARTAAAHPEPDKPIAWEDVRRGWENELGDVVLLSREEIEHARPQRSRTIDVEDFVDLSDIDPVFYEKTYYAVPQSPEAARPYALLHRAMLTAGRVGIGRFVLRTKPHLVAVRPMQDVLAVETLFFGDEVRDPSALVPWLDGVEVEERELDLAVQLVETLKTEWDPAAYADTYREELLRILSEKAATAVAREAPACTPSAGSPSAVEQLMAALKESVEAARENQGKRARSRKAG